MSSDPYHRQLLKFFIISATSFFIGTVHGVVQVLPPIRKWLDSIGSPYGGPGHMIDPLAHAHMNLVGGVVMLAMGATYYLLPSLTGRAIYSRKLVDWTFWCVIIGVYAFYAIQVGFGIYEGLLLTSQPEAIAGVHHIYGATTAIASTIMGIGFIIYMVNVCVTAFGRK